ncbi:MAG: TldD/PmbA family protein [Deltaproteobacteria bacterium]|nr:TldD/PmbA family protein [Candidatus Zymogenaceae bacterium]
MSDSKDIDYAKILKTILKNGGDYADIYYERTEGIFVVCEDNRVEKVISGIDAGIGLRLIRNFRTAYAYTNDPSESNLKSLARELSASFGPGSSSSPDIVLSRMKPPILLAIASDPTDIAVGRKIEYVVRANDTARAHQTIRQAKVIYRDSKKTVNIANTMGRLTSDIRTGTIFAVQVVAQKNGIIQTGYEPVGGTVGFELFDEHLPEQVAQTAVQRADLMLEAIPAPAGVLPVVLSSSAGGTMIHEAVGHGLEADLTGKKLSVYSGKIGQKVASDLITVIDDSTLPGRRGSFVFDDEGSPSQRTVLVENGILVEFMYDRLCALKEGKESTGNGRRESYRYKPIPRMTNTIIAPGTMNPEDIISSVKHGLLVKKMGGGQVNTVNGQFVFEVSEGYLIEAGKVTRPVRGAILTGKGPEVLGEIDMVGYDLGFGIGTCGKDGQGVPVADAQPTLRIPQITVGGRV